MQILKTKKASLGKILGIIFAVVAIAATAGTIFGTSGLNSTDFTTYAPAWLYTLAVLVVGFGILLLVAKASGMSGKFGK